MNYHSTTTTSGGMDGTDLAAIALVLWAVGGGGGGGGGLQGGGRDICRIVVVVKGEEEEEEEGRQQWEGADDHAVIVPPLRIRPREGQNMSCLLVFLLAIAQAIPFCRTDGSTMARIINERWQRSLPWVLRIDVVVPVTVSFFGCVAFQHWYLVPLCARVLYIIIGHDGVISPAWSSALLLCRTALAYTYVCSSGARKRSAKSYSCVSTTRTPSSCYRRCRHCATATGSAAVRVIGSSFPCLCFSPRPRASSSGS